MQLAAIVAALLLTYWGTLVGYLRDQRYQEHFVFLWVFLALALSRTVRRPFRSRFSLRSPRELAGVGACVVACLLLMISEVAGSSTGMRTSLVAFLTGIAVLVLPAWTVKRCLMHGLLLQLCFGIPYSVYAPFTRWMIGGVAAVVSLPARLGLADYVVESGVVKFPDYLLSITPDCSGVGQLTSFLGIAALGILSSQGNRSRTIWVLLLATALAWVANVARVLLFVALISFGWKGAVDDWYWHQAIGMFVFLPFVVLLIGVMLKTHVPIVPSVVTTAAPGRFALASTVVPLLVVHLFFGRVEEVSFPAPGYFASLESPPGHQLVMRSPTENVDRASYATPWLINVRFEHGGDGSMFDLLHYVTRSRSQLCVHGISACLDAPDQLVRVGEPLTIDGKRWYALSLDRGQADESLHVYYAFEVGGQRLDDSVATQLKVLWQRVTGGSWQVSLTRVTMPGLLPAEPTAYETSVLTWLGRTTDGP